MVKALILLHFDIKLLHVSQLGQVGVQHVFLTGQGHFLLSLSHCTHGHDGLSNAGKGELLVVHASRVRYQDGHRHLLCLYLFLGSVELEHAFVVT